MLIAFFWTVMLLFALVFGGGLYFAWKNSRGRAEMEELCRSSAGQPMAEVVEHFGYPIGTVKRNVDGQLCTDGELGNCSGSWDCPVADVFYRYGAVCFVCVGRSSDGTKVAGQRRLVLEP